jgi:hypothetical protein
VNKNGVLCLGCKYTPGLHLKVQIKVCIRGLNAVNLTGLETGPAYPAVESNGTALTHLVIHQARLPCQVFIIAAHLGD